MYCLNIVLVLSYSVLWLWSWNKYLLTDYGINTLNTANSINTNAAVRPVEKMAFLMWGMVKPISSSGVAISIEALLWTAGGDGDRVRTGPADKQHIGTPHHLRVPTKCNYATAPRPEKHCHSTFASNFAKCWPICKIISLTDQAVIWVVRYWRGYLSGARCKWFAYGPADATATPSSLAPVNSRMAYLSGAGLSRLSWKKAAKRML